MKMKKMKKLMTAMMAAALTLGLCTTPALAGDDFALPDMVKTITPSAVGGYNYNGWATVAGSPADSKYLQFTYTGDISTLRIEFQSGPDGTDFTKIGPYWFDSENEGSKFVSADGSTIPLTASSATTVTVDLAASGINFADFAELGGIHLHYGGGDENLLADGTQAVITDAKLTSSAPAAAAPAEETPAAETPAAETPASDNDAAAADSGSTTTTDKAKTDTKGAAKTGSTAIPTVAAGLVVLGAAAVLVRNKKRA